MARQPHSTEHPRQTTQAERWLLRLLERDRLRFVSLAVLAMALVLSVVTWTTSRDGGPSLLGPAPGADFAGFYMAGRLLSEYPSERLYDLKLQDRLFHQLFPAIPDDEILYFVHAPFFGLVFRPLAALPYAWAYWVWVPIAIGLYVAGLFLIGNPRDAPRRSDWPIALLLALSFEPFVMETLMGGQMSAFGFFVLALAWRCQMDRRRFLSGLALAGCLYKPTLLLVILPMLVIGRQALTLLGFAVGSLIGGGLSLVAVGGRGCRAYVDLLMGYSREVNQATTMFRDWKYVDLPAFLRLLPGELSFEVRSVLFALLAVGSMPLLIRLWGAFPALDDDAKRLVWSGTITWTLVFNLYVPVYDTILVVLGAVVTYQVLQRRSIPGAFTSPFGLRALLVALYLVPWFSQHLARSLGFQPFTVVLWALGAYQLALAGRLRVWAGSSWGGRFQMGQGLGG